MVNLEKRMQEQNNNIQIIKRKDIKKNGVENEMRILNPNVIYTKSQIKSAEKNG